MADETPPPGTAMQTIRTKTRYFVETLFSLPTILSLLLAGALYYIYVTSRGNVEGIANIHYARGLITLLFAVGTIAIALILTIASIFEKNLDGKTRFEHGREILGLLIGIFGTIVGFYFGSISPESKVAMGPTIDAIEPEEITQNTEATLTLRGRNFRTQDVVLVEGTVLKPTVGSSTQIEVVLPKEFTSLATEKAVRVLDSESGVLSNTVLLKIKPEESNGNVDSTRAEPQSGTDAKGEDI